jgi:hypothetical protein
VSCSLDAAAFEARVARGGGGAAPARPPAAPPPARARQRYRRDAGVEDELAALVAAEADCCPSVGFALSADDDALILDIRGSEAAVAPFVS